MAYGFLDIAITPSVRAAQAAMGSADAWVNFKGHREFDRFTGNEAAFIAERDSFYMASVSETGWPYVQYRGGPRGFLKQIDDQTLGFADFRGNRQYLTVGNVTADNRVSLILMDYPGRARLKILGRVEVKPLDEDPDLTGRLVASGYKARPERLMMVRLEAFDWNCPQHIVPRFTEQEVTEAIAPLRERLDAAESENARLRARLTGAGL